MAEQTLEQRRAAHALDIIKGLRDSDAYDKYLSYVDSFPASILTNGLGQASATLLAQAKRKKEQEPDQENKKEDDHVQLYKHLERWLCGDDPDVPYQGKEQLIESITSYDQDHYLRAQAEALAYLVWLKKFAKAFLKDKEKDKNHAG